MPDQERTVPEVPALDNVETTIPPNFFVVVQCRTTVCMCHDRLARQSHSGTGVVSRLCPLFLFTVVEVSVVQLWHAGLDCASGRATSEQEVGMLLQGVT